MEVGVLYLCFEVCFLLRWSNPVAEAYRNSLVNSIAFIDSHSVDGESRCLNCLCASGFNPTQPRNRWGALSLVVVRNSSSCYLRKLEEALGNNGTGITTTCHVAQFQEPRKSQPATWGRGRARVPFASETDTDTWLYKSLLTSPSRNLIYLWGSCFLSAGPTGTKGLWRQLGCIALCAAPGAQHGIPQVWNVECFHSIIHKGSH